VRPETVAPVKFAEDVTVNTPITACVVVDFVNTPVLGVVAPIGVFSIVPPLIVRASEIFPSESEPVIEPKLPSARVTPALPSVPELTAVAETLPVASIVSVLETIASVIELAGSATDEVTFNAPTFALAMLELLMVVVRKVVVALNVLLPVNALFALRYVKFAESERLVEDRPVTEPVIASVPVTVTLPALSEATLEVTNVVELENNPVAETVNALPESVMYGVPVTELMLLYKVK
jgi:hypothetical protein